MMEKEGDYMLLSWILLVILLFSSMISLYSGTGSALSTAAMEGAQNGITVTISIAGSICLWSGVAKLMEKAGITDLLSRILHPLLIRLFPATRTDRKLSQDLSTNICANILGLGNAATPPGIAAAKRLQNPQKPTEATDQLCRLVVLNTASIQLIPATVAALRSSLGCTTPLDILPAVWITSFSSAGLGLLAAWLLGRVCRP